MRGCICNINSLNELYQCVVYSSFNELILYACSLSRKYSKYIDAEHHYSSRPYRIEFYAIDKITFDSS